MHRIAYLRKKTIAVYRLFTLISLIAALPGLSQEFAYFRYEGRIGTQDVVMHLHRNAQVSDPNIQRMYQGVYYYLAYEIPIPVAGLAFLDGTLELHEGNGSMNLDLQPDGSFKGNWTSQDGDKVVPVSLTERYSGGAVPFSGAGFYDRRALFPDHRESPGMHVALYWLEPSASIGHEQRAYIQESIHRELAGKAIKCCPGGRGVFEAIRNEQFRLYNEEFGALARTDPDMPAQLLNFADELGVYVLYNSNGILSLAFNHYFYSGGAHGVHAVTTRSYDVDKRQRIKLQDRFRPGYETALQAALNKAARTYAGLGSDAPLKQYFLVDQIPITDNYYFTGKGVVFSYPPYEIAAFAEGQIELFVPFSSF